MTFTTTTPHPGVTPANPDQQDEPDYPDISPASSGSRIAWLKTWIIWGGERFGSTIRPRAVAIRQITWQFGMARSAGS